MKLRTLKVNEVNKLTDCLVALAEHHNAVSLYFGGDYPSRPFGRTLEMFAAALENGTSQITVVEEQNRIAGFCKTDFSAGSGKIDYLIVLPEYRGKGFGKALMDNAMQSFKNKNIKKIEVKVVAGNDAVRLYEKYGFKLNAQILKFAP